MAKLLPGYSRAKISHWIKSGQATVVQLLIESTPQQHWQAEVITLNIIYEDDEIIVINKPAGLVTHPDSGNSGIKQQIETLKIYYIILVATKNILYDTRIRLTSQEIQ